MSDNNIEQTWCTCWCVSVTS